LGPVANDDCDVDAPAVAADDSCTGIGLLVGEGDKSQLIQSL
jgi:hypothetical protein